MAKPPQLAAVALALVLVLSAAVYGIVRGVQSNADYSHTVCHRGSTQWIPGIGTISLPSRVPDGVDRVMACYSTGLLDLIYTNERGDKVFIINVSNFPSDDGTPVQLGGLVGQVVEHPNSKGGSSYLIQFEKAGRTYSVAATLDKNYGLPDNTVTPDELKAVALSIAEQERPAAAW